MQNFDSLNPGDAGKPAPPRRADAPPPRYPIWRWTINIDESHRVYCVVCLSNDTLFVRIEHPQPGDGCDVSRLNHEDPKVVFPRDYTRISLDSIPRIRFHIYYAWIDVVRVDGSVETIRDFETRITEHIFDSLHKRLAPRAPIEREAVRIEREIVFAVAVFLPIAIIAGMFMAVSLASEEELSKLNRTDFRVMLIESIGAPTTTLLSVGAILAGLAFIAYRVFNPPKTLTVIVKR